MSDTEDSDVYKEELMPKAFIIDGTVEDIDMEKPPASGFEFLLRVQKEADSIQDVVVADFNYDMYRSNQTVVIGDAKLHPAPKGFAPSQEWQRRQIEEFSHVRLHFCKYRSQIKPNARNKPRFPPRTEPEKWCKFRFGKIIPMRYETEVRESWLPDKKVEDIDHSGNPPYMNIIVHLDQPTIIQLLE